jgi:hypothetical protein
MAAVDMRADLSTLIDAVTKGDINQIIAAAREYLQQGIEADVLIGRIGMIAAHGDSDGHPTATLGSASMLARLAHWIPAPIDAQEAPKERTLPLLVQALKVAAPYARKGFDAYNNPQYPSPFFPSELLDTGRSVNDVMRDAVAKNDALLAERTLLGLYGTGADYRSMQVRAYESISNTFQENGHPLTFAVRGFQLLDTVEWGNRAPNIIHWLAPHLPLRPDTDEPAWIRTVRTFAAQHDLKVIRTRLAAAKDEHALPLRSIILSDTDTARVCQGIYDALVTNGASAQGVASVISLAAADVLQRVGDSDHDLFINVAHGLLFTTAVHVIFQQVRDVEVLNLLYTAASAINALHKKVSTEAVKTPQQTSHSTGAGTIGGGLLAIAQLETLGEQIKAQDLAAATTTVQRYLRLGHDARALFGTIGLVAALVDATAEQGHTLQIVQAASDAFLNWPHALSSTNADAFIQIALRAATTGKHDATVEALSS